MNLRNKNKITERGSTRAHTQADRERERVRERRRVKGETGGEERPFSTGATFCNKEGAASHIISQLRWNTDRGNVQKSVNIQVREYSNTPTLCYKGDGRNLQIRARLSGEGPEGEYAKGRIVFRLRK